MKCINSIQINNNNLVLNMTLNPVDSSQAILFTTTKIITNKMKTL